MQSDNKRKEKKRKRKEEKAKAKADEWDLPLYKRLKVGDTVDVSSGDMPD